MNNKPIALILAVAVLFGLVLSMCDDDSSSSGRKWSDLSETEKANARWAYQVTQALDD